MPAGEVIGSDHDLWQIKAFFRMSMTDPRARHTREETGAHLTIVSAPPAVGRSVQSCTGLGIRNVRRQLRPLRSSTLANNGTEQAFPPGSLHSNKASTIPPFTPNADTKQITVVRRPSL